MTVWLVQNIYYPDFQEVSEIEQNVECAAPEQGSKTVIPTDREKETV